ncbi:hypothetical protein [Bradyrhizobium sp. BR 1432]|uniref:hypothetical protein n=1 Tax=Bradyrhizobium sp. BR 1432 TaxID=3447966 RepID=UPI003EE7A222
MDLDAAGEACAPCARCDQIEAGRIADLRDRAADRGCTLDGPAMIRRFEAACLTWPLPKSVTDAVLEARPFAVAGATGAAPDCATVHRELKRKHVTLSILWEEDIAAEPDGYRL